MFLNTGRVHDYDELNKLFFQVLAVKEQDRSVPIKQKFAGIPYLNSSLFEPSELEHRTIRINSLDDHATLPILSNTVLKDKTGKKVSGESEPLSYFFRFLDAYDFSSEGAEDIQEESKTLINASVLGLIFEKINGYKDGSFFTPGFITMYMCHEIITRALVQKFNDAKGWSCETLTDIYNKNPEIGEANQIINSLKICDPAVGSGHFLVSALNEIIAIKSELGVLSDTNGKRLKDYNIEVINDELVVTDNEGKFFEYNPKSKESQRVQETLFREKQLIIENCLFGVDINPNSVKICRLRLWIELLKNAYYKTSSPVAGSPTPVAVLETLPNIDINIKGGNSLISRYPLDADIKTALRSSKWTVDNYREAVMTYRNAQSKDEKRKMEELIEKIKSDFETEVAKSDKRFLKLNKLKGELISLSDQTMLFELPKKEKEEWNKKVNKITVEIQCLESQVSEIKSNKIFENAFEWRFEFPEVLNNDGDFMGFDVVIGNPPYIPLEAFEFAIREYFKQIYPQFERKYETSVLFISRAFSILNKNGVITFIAPGTWQTGENYSKFRSILIDKRSINTIVNLPFNIFEDAFIDTSIYFLGNTHLDKYKIFNFDKKNSNISLKSLLFNEIALSELQAPDYKLILDPEAFSLYKKYSSASFVVLGEITKSTQGLSGSRFNIAKDEDSQEYLFPFLSKGNVYNYLLVKENVFQTDLSDKKSLTQFYEADPKILIRRIINRQNRLSVGFTEERMVFKKDINPFICIDKRFSSKFLLGILASKLISFIYIKMSSIALKDDFRQTTLGELRNLPVPLVNTTKQKTVIDIVDQILDRKKSDPNTNTSSLETEIDRLVYELYGLTEEEIRIVEEGEKGRMER